MAQVKVSGPIPQLQHKRISKLAAEHGTTIGVLVAAGIDEIERKLTSKPAHAARLKRDKRRKGENN